MLVSLIFEGYAGDPVSLNDQSSNLRILSLLLSSDAHAIILSAVGY
jgi:hypothetical protein